MVRKYANGLESIPFIQKPEENVERSLISPDLLGAFRQKIQDGSLLDEPYFVLWPPDEIASKNFPKIMCGYNSSFSELERT